MSTIQVHEVCKVRNAAVGRAGDGYSLAVFKKANKASARVVVLDASFVPGKELVTVQLNTLWKVKASQRKTLERKVTKACAPPPPPKPLAPPPLFAKIEPSVASVMGLLTSFKVTLGGSGTAMYIAFDSVVKFTGYAIVNAANEGCLGGGGIDGEIGRRGGETLYAARCALPVLNGGNRCPTGDAKITVAGDLPCSKVIHAVGPAFGYSPHLSDHADKLELLEAAYKNSMERARENELKSVGFCILSAGIFRGGCPLKIVIETGLKAIAKNTYPGLETVVFCGFTAQEQAELHDFAASVA